MDKNTQLERELKYRIRNCHRLGRFNYYYAYSVIVIAITASIVATYSVATGRFPIAYNALLTAAPGILLLVNRTLKFEDKARWYWKHTRYLDGLLREMEFEGKQADEISKKLTEIDEKLDAEWPGFGKIPSPIQATDPNSS